MEVKDLLISVIVPVYNVEQYLSRCIDSIIHQTYHNLEIILIDDGSQDRCGEICYEYALRDNRIKVLHQENAGVTAARIKGLEESQGNYVTFIDSDDYISPQFVEHLYHNLMNYDADMSCCQIIQKYKHREIEDVREERGFFDEVRIKQLLAKDFLYNYKIKKAAFFTGQCGKLIKKDLLVKALREAQGFWQGEDVIMNLSLMYNMSSLYISASPLYYYVQHEGQATRCASKADFDNWVKHWYKIEELDKLKLLKDQIPYRCLRWIQIFIKNSIMCKTTYMDFCRLISGALDEPIIDKYIVKYQFKALSMVDSIFVFLLRRRHYAFLYGLSSFGVFFLRCRNLIRQPKCSV